jgi:hypothetical protein
VHAATSLYGSRAANGVSLITTKKGGKNKALGVAYYAETLRLVMDKCTLPNTTKNMEPAMDLDWYSDSDRGPGILRLETVMESMTITFRPTKDASMWRSVGPQAECLPMEFINHPVLDTYGKALPWVAAKKTH